MTNYSKYLKYKAKYLSLKDQYNGTGQSEKAKLFYPYRELLGALNTFYQELKCCADDITRTFPFTNEYQLKFIETIFNNFIKFQAEVGEIMAPIVSSLERMAEKIDNQSIIIALKETFLPALDKIFQSYRQFLLNVDKDIKEYKIPYYEISIKRHLQPGCQLGERGCCDITINSQCYFFLIVQKWPRLTMPIKEMAKMMPEDQFLKSLYQELEYKTKELNELIGKIDDRGKVNILEFLSGDKRIRQMIRAKYGDLKISIN